MGPRSGDVRAGHGRSLRLLLRVLHPERVPEPHLAGLGGGGEDPAGAPSLMGKGGGGWPKGVESTVFCFFLKKEPFFMFLFFVLLFFFSFFFCFFGNPPRTLVTFSGFGVFQGLE